VTNSPVQQSSSTVQQVQPVLFRLALLCASRSGQRNSLHMQMLMPVHAESEVATWLHAVMLCDGLGSQTTQCSAPSLPMRQSFKSWKT
jgi:hypothetical protein